jgi:catechol 2,3-dioxygenase-like lactoylglutathione lyase family enzyme
MTPSAPGRPPITQVFETVLYAQDVLAVVPFYTEILGLTPLRPPTAQSTVFRLARDSMLLLVNPDYSRQTGRAAPHHGTTGAGHAALRIDDADYDAWKAWLTARGIEIEKEVAWPPGGRSIYFRDPAGNSLELAAGNVWGG